MKQFNDKILINYPILSLENFQENFFTHQSPTSALTDYETANFAGNVAVFVFNLQGSVAECKNLRVWYRFSLFEKCLPIHSGSILLNSARLLEEMLGNHYRDWSGHFRDGYTGIFTILRRLKYMGGLHLQHISRFVSYCELSPKWIRQRLYLQHKSRIMIYCELLPIWNTFASLY